MNKLLFRYISLFRKLLPKKRVVTKQLIDHLVEVSRTRTHFNPGDRVVGTHGDTGEVVLVFRDIKTNVPVGCAVRWDNEINPGSALSTFLPVVDLGKKYNPIIRKY